MSPFSGPRGWDADGDSEADFEADSDGDGDSLAEEPEPALPPEVEPEPSSSPQPASTTEPSTTVAVRRASLFRGSRRVTPRKLPRATERNALGRAGTRMTWWGHGRPRRLHDGRERRERRPEGQDAR